jgi:cyclohexanone monooxygenase
MNSQTQTFDVIVVGAGFAGMYMLHRLREMGFTARVIEAASDVGGTWYWNRYPGARCDVPSMEYSLSFSKELEQEWNWAELMSAQPEILTYANHVADRFDLRRDIQFETRVTSARYDADVNRWLIETDRDDRYSARYCVMATGCLSVPMTPEIEGAADFVGEVVHTGCWPKEGVELADRRVGIIGTGSSGVQAIPEIAKVAEHLFVFQRTPTYTFPANNRPLKQAYQQAFKAHYAEVRDTQRYSPGGFSGFRPSRNDPETASAIVVDEKRSERSSIKDASVEVLRQAMRERGFGVFQAYRDVYTDLEANEIACELYRDWVDQLVDDPLVAEALKPRGYPLGCKRQVLDTHYYATFNRPNVTLVDLTRHDIESITATGLRTASASFEFDVLIYATGFDAMTGALNRIDIRGRGGKALKDKWADGPRAYLGLQSEGFPNLFTVTGPGSPSVLSNVLVSIEQHVDWIADCLRYLDDNGMRTIEPERAAEDAWIEHVNEVAEHTMYTAPSCNSWYLGTNVPGKPRIFMPYVGGVGRYRRKCEDVVAKGYEGFCLSR